LKEWSEHEDAYHHRHRGVYRVLHHEKPAAVAGKDRAMNQSTAIAAALFLSFLIYITMKGKLPTYVGFIV
jgi:hypothetical protein